MLLLFEMALVIVLPHPCPRPMPGPFCLRQRAVGAACCADGKADDTDDMPTGSAAAAPRGFGSAPRGFGFGGAALDEVRGWDDEEEEDLELMPAEVRAKRDRVLLKWANFVQSVGAARAPPAPPIAALRNVSLDLGGQPILHQVSWEAWCAAGSRSRGLRVQGTGYRGVWVSALDSRLPSLLCAPRGAGVETMYPVPCTL